MGIEKTISSFARRTLSALAKPQSIAPLVVFRVIFGLTMVAAIVRFWAHGWIRELYIDPTFYFSYSGFEWIKPLGDPGMYLLYAAAAVAALCIALGLFYRYATVGFFAIFTYLELLDKTNYLNHYYFVSVVAFLLIFIPAHRRFSLDVRLGTVRPVHQTASFYRFILIAQLALVYFFAGLAKVNSDWLLSAQPMTIWLKSFGHWPLVGPLFDMDATAYAFSWAGMIYDLTIPVLLLMSRTRKYAYAAVIVFHTLTWLFFPIGMFPFVMIGATLIFFPPTFHEGLLRRVAGTPTISAPADTYDRRRPLKWMAMIGGLFLAVQVLVPLRHHMCSGELFWHEYGYRFSWRVMLMEKAGAAFFYVDGENMPRPMEVRNCDFLTRQQEKMMATQPDMLVQYARHLKNEYENRGVINPRITARAYVTLNGRPSRPYVDPTVDLSRAETGTGRTNWLIPFDDEIRGF